MSNHRVNVARRSIAKQSNTNDPMVQDDNTSPPPSPTSSVSLHKRQMSVTEIEQVEKRQRASSQLSFLRSDTTQVNLRSPTPVSIREPMSKENRPILSKAQYEDMKASLPPGFISASYQEYLARQSQPAPEVNRRATSPALTETISDYSAAIHQNPAGRSSTPYSLLRNMDPPAGKTAAWIETLPSSPARSVLPVPPSSVLAGGSFAESIPPSDSISNAPPISKKLATSIDLSAAKNDTTSKVGSTSTAKLKNARSTNRATATQKNLPADYLRVVSHREFKEMILTLVHFEDPFYYARYTSDNLGSRVTASWASVCSKLNLTESSLNDDNEAASNAREYILRNTKSTLSNFRTNIEPPVKQYYRLSLSPGEDRTHVKARQRVALRTFYFEEPDVDNPEGFLLNDILPYVAYHAIAAKNNRLLGRSGVEHFLQKINPVFVCCAAVQVRAILHYFEKGERDTAAAGSNNATPVLRELYEKLLAEFQVAWPYNGGGGDCLRTQYFAWFRKRFADFRKEACGEEEKEPIRVIVPADKATTAQKLALLRKKMGLISETSADKEEGGKAADGNLETGNVQPSTEEEHPVAEKSVQNSGSKNQEDNDDEEQEFGDAQSQLVDDEEKVDGTKVSAGDSPEVVNVSRLDENEEEEEVIRVARRYRTRRSAGAD